MIRRVLAYKNYFIDFYKSQDLKVQEKIEYVLDLIRFERQVPKKFLKYLEGTDRIYEIRVFTAFKNLRILCFFDADQLLVLMNCFVTKTQKTPRKEIKRAEEIRKEYFIDKKSG